jgi:hypothetical protein
MGRQDSSVKMVSSRGGAGVAVAASGGITGGGTRIFGSGTI